MTSSLKTEWAYSGFGVSQNLSVTYLLKTLTHLVTAPGPTWSMAH